MKKLIVAAIAMALSAPVFAQGPQPAGDAASDNSRVNTPAWIYSGIATAAVIYALCDDGDSSSSDDNGGGGTGGTTGTGGGGTGGTTGTGG